MLARGTTHVSRTGWHVPARSAHTLRTSCQILARSVHVRSADRPITIRSTPARTPGLTVDLSPLFLHTPNLGVEAHHSNYLAMESTPSAKLDPPAPPRFLICEAAERLDPDNHVHPNQEDGHATESGHLQADIHPFE